LLRWPPTTARRRLAASIVWMGGCVAGGGRLCSFRDLFLDKAAG
jgi:hypothetical protein